ncbi:hypothetical protein ACFY36_00580 [Actinoplanes sp. NPDC000266]
MRRAVSAGITAIALGGALLVGGGSPAAAATPVSAAKPVVQVAPDGAVRQYYDWYWTRANCNAAGSAMLVRHIIYGYECTLSGYLTWYLYVSY